MAVSMTFAASLVGPAIVYRLSVGSSRWALAGYVLSFGVVLGLTLGAIFPRVRTVALAIAAFAGIFAVWMPVVFVTYGLAVAALPVLLAYAAAVAFAAALSARARTLAEEKQQ